MGSLEEFERHDAIYKALKGNLKNYFGGDFMSENAYMIQHHSRAYWRTSQTFYNMLLGPKNTPFLQCFTCEHASNFRSRYP